MMTPLFFLCVSKGCILITAFNRNRVLQRYFVSSISTFSKSTSSSKVKSRSPYFTMFRNLLIMAVAAVAFAKPDPAPKNPIYDRDQSIIFGAIGGVLIILYVFVSAYMRGNIAAAKEIEEIKKKAKLEANAAEVERVRATSGVSNPIRGSMGTSK